MGVVYKAQQKNAGRLVALKLIRAERLTSDADVQRFRNEAEAAAQLDHPHIVSVYEVGARPGHFFFSMKLIEGGGLDERLDRFRDDRRGAARLVAQVARAVHHAHQRGILHRDLKPSNILLDPEGHPHVSDFGLAKRIEADVSLTQTGAIVGTPQYMAPEQTSGRKGAVTTATDVYGLGAVLYALLTGQPPFQGDTVLETLEQVREREPQPPRRINAKVDRDLETICLKCLQKEPQRRYESAQALADDLERWLAGEPIRGRRAGRWERLMKWMRRRPALATLAIVTALSSLGFIAGLIWHNTQLQESAWREHQAAEEARIQRDKAREQRKRARKTVDDMYTQVADKWLSNQPRLTEVEAEFLAKAARYYEDFAHEEEADPKVWSEAALAYARLGVIQHNLGNYKEAEKAHRRQIALWEKVVADVPSDPRYRNALINAHNHLANVLAYVGRQSEAETEYRLAVRLQEELVAAYPSVPGYRKNLGGYYSNLGEILRGVGRPREAEEAYRQAIKAWSEVTEFPSDKVDAQRRLILAWTNLANLLDDLGRYPEEESLCRQAVSMARKTAEVPHPHQQEDTDRLAKALRLVFGTLLEA